jgi:hypothetical protein
MPRDLKYDPAKTYSLTKFCFHYRTANSGQSYIIRLNYETRAYAYKDRRSLSGPPISFPPPYFLFDTATTTTGRISFGPHPVGRASADAACAADPDRPPICSPANTWAFMSFSPTDEIIDMPLTRNIATTSRWYARDGGHTGVLIANNWADLMDGSIAQPLVNGGFDGIYWSFSTVGGVLYRGGCAGGTYGGGTNWSSVGHRDWDWGWKWLVRYAGWCNSTSHLLCVCH